MHKINLTLIISILFTSHPINSTEIENINPNTTFSQRKSYEETSMNTDSGTLKLCGQLKERQSLNQLGRPSYRNINLYMVSGTDDQYFHDNGYLIVSPRLINPNVEILSLSMCGLEDKNIKEIGGFRDLENLNLSTNKITDKGVENIAPLEKLRVLNLHFNNISDKALELLFNCKIPFKSLDISSNKDVTDNSVPYILKISGLEYLCITSTSISYKMYEEIQTQLPNLKIDY